MHGGGSVLFMMTTKFASQETNKKHTNYKECNKSPFSLTTISTPKQQNTQITSENNNGNQHPAPSNKLTAQMQFFQMRKMDQR